MTARLDVTFAPLDATPEAVLVLLCGHELVLGRIARRLDDAARGALTKAAKAADFTGKSRSSIEILAPSGLESARVILMGTGDGSAATDLDWTQLGGVSGAKIAARKCRSASLVVDVAGSDRVTATIAADLASGALLQGYKFTKYRSRRTSRENGATDGNGNGPDSTDGLERLVVHVADPQAAEIAFARRRAVAEGVFVARDLVNEPGNVLGPVEFAERTRDLARVGVEVEVLDVEALAALKMNALLGVGQGSVRPSRVVVMQWHGTKSKRAKPVCFVGKGVTFDTGGISIKPAGGMEDMKGDMGGAACVVGLMHALAARKANVNAVGLIGLAENMPSGSAQRPGDIVMSMSGQTIEVLNTDAEGRLVLADVLWYAQERFKPRFVVDLATLTGAIMVALGKEFAGMFANDDKLAGELSKAGEAVAERVWRMPLDKAYDKLIDSKTADMKNIGGRYGGAITAAQFLQRFIKDTPWAHLDVAGTAMDSARTDLNTSWASGWGVRLLDRLVADGYEKG